MKKLGRNASLCFVIYSFFYCNIEFFFHAVGVFISWLNTCSNSWTQLPQTRSLCWVIFGGDGSAEEVKRVFHPLWGENWLYPVDYCCLVPLTLPTPQSELKKQTLWCCGILFAKLNRITLDILKGRNSLWVMRAATSFFLYWGFSLCCFRWPRSGTNTKQTLLLSDATVESKKSKDSMDLTFLGLGGVTQNPYPPDPPPVKLRKLKWGLKRTEKKTKI